MATEQKNPLALLSAEGNLESWQFLEELIKEPEFQIALVDYIAENSPVNKWQAKFALKLIAPLIAKRGKWLSDASVGRLTEQLQKFRFAQKVIEILNEALTGVAKTAAAREEFRALLKGHGKARDLKLADELPLGQQGDLAILHRIEGLDKTLRSIKERLNAQPPLELPIYEAAEEIRFLYSAMVIPFLGREAETAKLDDFLYSGDEFSWWIVTGPGGAGKSRFVFELCLSQSAMWLTGFLPRRSLENDFDWDNWQPERPTFIVIDYAAGAPKQVQGIIHALTRRADGLDFPVRLLLLDRDASEQSLWFKDLIGTGSDIPKSKRCMRGEPLALDRLGDDDLWCFFELAFQKSDLALPDREETFKRFKEIDPQTRPLYAHFMADALAAGGSAGHWDQKRLVADILERARTKIWPKDVSDKELYLVALATVIGGLQREKLKKIKADWLPGYHEVKTERYRCITGRAVQKDFLAPLEPDILGELFVLQLIAPGPSLGSESARGNKLRDLAWETSPKEFALFLFRAVSDFPDNDMLKVLLKTSNLSALGQIVWSFAAVNVLSAYGKARKIETARGLYDEIAVLAVEHPKEPALRESQAMAVVNLINLYRNAGDIGAARELYASIAVLEDVYPDEPARSKLQANAAINLIVAYGEAGEIELAKEFYGDIKTLAAAHSDEPVLRDTQAKAAFNLMNLCRDIGGVEIAREFYDVIAALYDAYPDESELRATQAMAAVNLVFEYGKVGDSERARKLYRTIATLAEAHSDGHTWREWRAMAAINLIIAYRNSGDIEAAREIYDDLKMLAMANSDEPMLRSRWARAYLMLLLLYENEGRSEQAEKWMEELKNHPEMAADLDRLMAAIEKKVQNHSPKPQKTG